MSSSQRGADRVRRTGKPSTQLGPESLHPLEGDRRRGLELLCPERDAQLLQHPTKFVETRFMHTATAVRRQTPLIGLPPSSNLLLPLSVFGRVDAELVQANLNG